MKTIAFTVLLILSTTFSACGESSSESDQVIFPKVEFTSSSINTIPQERLRKVTEKQLLGRWQLVIEVEDLIKQETIEENELVQSFLTGVGSLVQRIIDKIDIQFEFYEDNTVDIFIHSNNITNDVEPEIERLRWEINKQGELIIEDIEKNDHINLSGDGVWMLQGGKLVHLEDGEVKPQIYMQRPAI